MVIVCLFFLPSILLASPQSQTLVTAGRLALFKNGNMTWQGIVDANEKFKAAVAADAADQTAHLFYAVTRLGSFVLKTDDTAGLQTLADLFQALGIPIHLDGLMDTGSPFGELPELNGAYNPPVTMPNGDEVRSVLSPAFVGVIDLALANLDKIGTTIQVSLTAQETGSDFATEVDYTDVLLARAVMSGLKSMVLILSAYDLDAVDLREVLALSNSNMMSLHPDMITQILAKYPDFLKLAANGATLLGQAKTAFQSAYTNLSAAFTALKAESDVQDNDLFTFESKGDKQEFQNVLNGFSELVTSLVQNRPVTVQNVETTWDIITNNNDTIRMTLPEIRFGNGSVFRESSDFWGTLGNNDVQGGVPYWNIDGSAVEIVLEYFLESRGDVRIEVSGTLSQDGSSMSGVWSYQENDGSGYIEMQTGQFDGALVSQDSEDALRFDLNRVFGNTNKSPLDIRAILPEFDVFGEPKAGTFPDPVLNGIFPDLDTNAKLSGELELDAPYKVFTIPAATQTEIAGDPSGFAAKFLVSTDAADDFSSDQYQVQGMDILNTYLAKDNTNLYLAMKLAGAPMTVFPNGNQPVYYQFEIRKSPDDWSRDVFRIHTWYNQQPPLAGAPVPGWTITISKADSNGNDSFITSLGKEYLDIGNTYIKLKVPLTHFPALETFGGQWITSGTWSQAIQDGDWVDSNIKLAPVFTVSGSVTVPTGYKGGKIYFYLTDNENPPENGNAIIGTYLDSAGNFTLIDAPYSAQNKYLHVLWDTDGNGIPNAGDYKAVKSIVIQGNAIVGTIAPQKTIADFPIEAVSVKSVHSGDNQFRTFFEVVMGQGFKGNVPDDIDTIEVTWPDGTTHQIYPDGGGYWDTANNEFFQETPGNPILGKYTFVVTAKDGRIGVKSDIQKDLITIPIVDVNTVKINKSSKTPVFSWEPVTAPGTRIAYRLEIRKMGEDAPFFRTGRDWDMTGCAVPNSILTPGQQYQYRIRAIDHTDWILVDNRSHTNWISFTMAAALSHAAVPAVDLDGWGAVDWRNSDSFSGFDTWVKIVDHDGVAYNGASHTVSAVFLDQGGNQLGQTQAQLNFQYAENGKAGYYGTWINFDMVNALPSFPAAIKFIVSDPDGKTGSTTDVLEGQPVTPPDNVALTCTVAGTTPTFTWNAFTRANHYRIQIYDEHSNTIWKGYPGNVTTYTLPAGILEPQTLYQYRLDARDAHSAFDTDHSFRIPLGGQPNPTFTTGDRVDTPFIETTPVGVESFSDDYRGTFTGFWIRVYDAQGVPGNIQDVQVIHPDGTTRTRLYYEYNESENCAIYSNNSYAPRQNGVYTFVATDKDQHEFSLNETLDMNPIGYPAQSSLSVVVTGTAAEFDWDDVAGAAFYRLEIYNTRHERIFRFETTQSQYTLAPGFLKAGEVYGFLVTTRREFFDDNTDNTSRSPWNDNWAIGFKTQPALAGGSSLPAIATGNLGAAVTYLTHPVTGNPSYWLQFSVEVTDNDGVPGNIKSVTVQGPGIQGSLALNYDEPGQGNTALYWNALIYDAMADIPEGLYTFTVEDENGNRATTTDTLVKKAIPLAPAQIPADDAVVTSDSPVIDWADPAGGPYVYQVKIYQHWDKLIHESGMLNASSYVVPAGILLPEEIYGYRIYVFDKDIRTQDVDNLSINQIFFTKQNHFTTGPEGSATEWNLENIFKMIRIPIGRKADIYSHEGDMNRDGRLNMQDIIPMIQKAGGVRIDLPSNDLSVNPYTSDANTILLDHLNGATGASILAFSNTGAACGPARPSATPVLSYGPGPSGLDQAVTLNPPAGEPAGSVTYLKYPGGQLVSQSNGTIEFWIYLKSYGQSGMSLVEQGPYPGSCAGWTFYMGINSSGQLRSAAWAAFDMNSGTTTVPLNTWTHVAATWGSNGSKLYINGILSGSDTNTGMPAGGYGGSVMVNYGNPAADTKIDELRISNIQRTTFNVDFL